MLHIVTGPPAAGKTTHVAKHAQPGDIRIDLDHITNLLAGKEQDNHQHEAPALIVGRAARQAAITAALAQSAAVDVWIIHTNPTNQQLQEYRKHGAKIHTINPGKQTVMQRCKTQRPQGSLHAAAQWYDQHQSSPRKTTTQRGLGHNHQQQRARLLRNLKPGTLCQWCGRPMYADQKLDADHQKSRHHGGHQANRLLHSACNSQRQAGNNDNRRPTSGRPDALKPPKIMLKTGKPDPRMVPQPAEPPPAFRW